MLESFLLTKKPIPEDPYTSEFLSHFEGTNGSLLVTDEKGRKLALTSSSGNTSIVTTNKKFGSSCLRMAGGSTGGYIKFVDSYAALMTLGGDYTIECFVYISTTQTSPFVITSDSITGGKYFPLVIRNSTTSTGKPYCEIGTWIDGLDNGGFTMGECPPVTNKWTHIATSRKGKTYRFFVDGKMVFERIATVSYVPVYVGSLLGWSNYQDYNFRGMVDELRILKDIAAYQSEFTPPVRAFTK